MPEPQGRHRGLPVTLPAAHFVELQQVFENASEQEHPVECGWNDGRPSPRLCPRCYLGVLAERISVRRNRA